MDSTPTQQLRSIKPETKSENAPEEDSKRWAKTDYRYWHSRVRKTCNSRGQQSPHYSISLMFQGRRLGFGLRTADQMVAAKHARDIYRDLITIGVEATRKKHRGEQEQKTDTSTEVITIGAWINAARAVFAGKDSTFGSYARSLRSIASDIEKVSKSKKRFAPKKETAYRRKIDALPLDILTKNAIQTWRIDFVKRAGTAADAKSSARTSANSMMRQAKALFSPKITQYISEFKIPSPLPFDGCSFYERQNMQYHSKLNPARLLQSARKELAESDTEVFKALLLALGAGLRRREISTLLWRQVIFKKAVLRLEVTEAGDLKTIDSTGDVPIDPKTLSFLKAWKEKATGPFVIEYNKKTEGGSRPWGQKYRCEGVFVRLIAWLRKNGLDAKKPIHTLRKEAGSLVSTKSGIHAASRFLRHSDIQVTSMFYADHKERVTVDIGEFLSEEISEAE